MILPPHFTVTITGDTSAFRQTPRSRETFNYLNHRLLCGDEVAEAEFASWGLKVEVGDG